MRQTGGVWGCGGDDQMAIVIEVGVGIFDILILDPVETVRVKMLATEAVAS